jgi:cellulose synthase operon protein YhjU
MGLWNFYFFSKCYLFYRGFIQFDFFLNLLFFLLLVIPIPAGVRFYRILKGVKLVFGLIISFLLLWHDSWLPSFHKTITFLLNEGLPLKEYLFQFSRGFVNNFELMIIGLLFVLCYLANRKGIRLTPVAFILLLMIPLQGYHHGPSGNVDKVAVDFFKDEKKRLVRFVRPAGDSGGIDIVILHVCSLSWEDLKEIGMEKDSFFDQFDYLMTRFNGVTSYSGPSAIRLLRANCGQPRHKGLYQDVPEECYLFPALQALDYQTEAVLNHDGVYGHFSQEIQALGHLKPPILPRDLPIQSYNFDGSIIYDDYAVLEKWWREQQAASSQKVAVYYNTISLHEGTHLNGEKDWWKQDRKTRYRTSALKLFSDFTKFFHLFESSGRKGIILFVPEHGVALRGSRIQAAGLREIPLPQITTVPVGIKLIGFDKVNLDVRPVIISKQVSYLSLPFLLSQFVKNTPIEVNVNQIPETDFISENEEAMIVKNGEEVYLYGKEKEWIKLPSELVN